MTRDLFTTARGFVWSRERAGEGPPVLALHGVGGGAYFFRGLAERLGLRYEVTATDLPSPPASAAGSDPGSMGSWAVDVAEIIEAVIGEPVVIVGHSLGTILGLEVWRRRPDLVRAMVFVGGLPEVRDAVRARLRERVVAIEAAGRMDGWGARVSPGIFGRRALEEKPELVGLFERLFEAQDPGLYVHNLKALLAASATDVVPTVTVPCLSITGAEDAYAPPDFVSAFIARLPQPCEQVLLDGVGHMPFFEAPDEFARAVGAFLVGRGGGRAPRIAASRSERWFDAYDGQTTDELLAREPDYRIDSLVAAFEQALYQRAGERSAAERYILAVEALEREVNNGGYDQFFLNSSHDFIDVIEEALEAIGCPKTAATTGDAIRALGLDDSPTGEEAEAAVLAETPEVKAALSACDDRYFANPEPIADRLFAWIKENREQVRIGR